VIVEEMIRTIESYEFDPRWTCRDCGGRTIVRENGKWWTFSCPRCGSWHECLRGLWTRVDLLNEQVKARVRQGQRQARLVKLGDKTPKGRRVMGVGGREQGVGREPDYGQDM